VFTLSTSFILTFWHGVACARTTSCTYFLAKPSTTKLCPVLVNIRLPLPQGAGGKLHSRNKIVPNTAKLCWVAIKNRYQVAIKNRYLRALSNLVHVSFAKK